MGPRVGNSARVSQAALQAELVRGAMVRNTQSISPKPDPLPPAPPLGLVSLLVIGLIAVVGELFKRISQLWGSNNSRGKQKAIWENYAYFRVIGFEGYGWRSTSTHFPFAVANRSLTPDKVQWPGKIAFNVVSPDIAVGGAMAGYGIFAKSEDWESFNYYSMYGGKVYGSAEYGAPFIGLAVSYEFSDSSSGNDVLATYSGYSNIPTEPQQDPYSRDTALPPPITKATILDRLPPVPIPAAAAARAAVLRPAQIPTTPDGSGAETASIPLAPTAAAAAAVTRFFRPTRLPTLPRPTGVRPATAPGTYAPPAPAAQTLPQTATDLRRYGSQVITSLGVRPDLASIAEEVGRMERKLGVMLEGADRTPDWFDSLLGPLLNELKDQILDALVVDVPATVYAFGAPCDKDGEGDPLVHQAEIEAADYQPAIVARLDAIAEAMGVLKSWKSPTCRTSSPRSNVTVTAFEFNPES
jgi:hypothetical protein